MKTLQKILVTIILIILSSSTLAMENLFYAERGDSLNNIAYSLSVTKSLNEHHKAINIFCPQAYQVNEHGTVWGNIDSRFLAAAEKNHIKIMPLITNQGFNSKKTHQLLTDSIATQEAINNMVKVCKQNNFYGLQVDFENVHIADKDAFNDFYKKLATAFHKNNLKISASIFPRNSDDGGKSDFTRAVYDMAAGSFDYKVFGEYSDFVSIMIYNQHIGQTTPGPVAAYPWAESIIKYALKYMPSEKISFGVPVYSTYWFSSMHGGLHVAQTGLSYNNSKDLIAKSQGQLLWDKYAKVHYAFFSKHDLYEYIFIEDAQSLKEKLALVKKYKLRGISVWALGYEDPNIWKVFK